MALLGILSGLPLAILGTGWQFATDFAPGVALISTIPNTLATVPMTMGYVGLLTLWDKQSGQFFVIRIRAVGRMALTNYLTQSILGIIMLRLVLERGSVSRSEIAIFIVGVWALQIFWSKYCLDRYPYGPFEWAWRRFTYLGHRDWNPLRSI